jgi:hypothetical protein
VLISVIVLAAFHTAKLQFSERNTKEKPVYLLAAGEKTSEAFQLFQFQFGFWG